MTIALLAIEIRHERRVRCVFSQAVAAGAYVAGLYTVTSLDAVGVSPGVSAALMLTTSPNVVELVLDQDLVKGGLYSLSAVDVPAGDATVTSAAAVEQFRFGITLDKTNIDPVKLNRDRILYGVDLLWNGVDYQETATGDLDTVGGTANVNKALRRRVDSNGLKWDRSHGVGAREFVDTPSVGSGTLRGKMNAQFLLDPRVKEVTVTVDFNDSDEVYLHAQPKLVSGEAIQPVSLVVPNNG